MMPYLFPRLWLKPPALVSLCTHDFTERGGLMNDILSFLWILGKVLLVAMPVTLVVAF